MILYKLKNEPYYEIDKEHADRFTEIEEIDTDTMEHVYESDEIDVYFKDGIYTVLSTDGFYREVFQSDNISELLIQELNAVK